MINEVMEQTGIFADSEVTSIFVVDTNATSD
jgi:hypothetical protein